MSEAVQTVDLGFCTDGDWVEKDTSGKLLWLPQGADERVVGRYSTDQEHPPILFTGAIRKAGVGRNKFITSMENKYGDDFNHVPSGVYRENLGELISGSKIVVAPDTPVTDRYYSNRVYMALGFGAFMLHKHSENLAKHYAADELVTYSDLQELHTLIKYFLDQPEERKTISDAGLTRTIKDHLYRHRCKQLVSTVEEKLL